MTHLKILLKVVLTFHILFSSVQLLAAQKAYELNIENFSANFTGVEVNHALGISQTLPFKKEVSIPAPTLRFKVGDEAVITVYNKTSEPATLHWHGLLVPWLQDGPQFSNTKIIAPQSKHVFSFPIIHSGTYWYHSHTELQEQRGLYGAIVIEDDHPITEVDHDFVYLMSDWTNELPKAVLYNLKKDGDYYGIKKDFLPTLWGAIRAGKLGDYLKSQWTRMGAMDLSDVGYDAFLINGKVTSTLKDIKHGERVRFRVINASASTYFYFNIGNNRKFKVITKDGMPVQPVAVSELLVGVAETYDIVFEMPHQMKLFEAKATAQDITGAASLTFGSGEIETVPAKMKPSPYGMGGMDHTGGHGDGHTPPGDDDDEPRDDDEPGDNDDGPSDDEPGDDDHGNHSLENNKNDKNPNTHSMPMPSMDMGQAKRLSYEMLKSTEPTNLDESLIRAQVIDLELSGDMERYTWNINGKPFSEDKYITIKENEVITFRYINKTMMHHPMHLHGHFFRVLNGQGDYSPLFHTVDVAPMKTVTIEFHANEPGIWFLHCHNLYHMKMGMARLVRYEGFEPTPELKEDEAKWGSYMTKDDDAFFRAEASIYSNTASLDVGINAGRYEVEMELEVDDYDPDNFEAEFMFRRYLSRFLSVGAGAVVEDQEAYAALTAAYNLPGNIEMEGYIRQDGKAVVRLFKSIPLVEVYDRPLIFSIEPGFSYLDQFEWSFETELEYMFSRRMSFALNYTREEDGDSSIGFGIKIRF